MSDRVYLSEAVLASVSPQTPAGRDLRFEAIFAEIVEAVRGDNGAQNKPNWRKVAERSLDALLVSKDLRLCCFLTEAGIHLDGFPALRDCLRLTRELLTRFWDTGLLPLVEEGDLDYRSAPLTWFNERMADAIAQIPLTARGDIGENYCFGQFLQAQRIGTEEGLLRLSGDRLAMAKDLISKGCITLDAFNSAMEETGRNALDAIYVPFDEARKQFIDLQRVIDDKFGAAAPGLGDASEAFERIRTLLAEAYTKKHRSEVPSVPAAVAAVAVSGSSAPAQAALAPSITAGSATVTGTTDSSSWEKAEELVRTGSVDEALRQFKALAALETSGRARFLRQLKFVDVCRKEGRERLERTILEEMNRVITEHKLAAWEASDIVGSVWSRLYRLYKTSKNDSDQEQANVLYNQLCRLDPWQTFVDCED
jgi:type VI secretion system ImpA family protein